MPVCDNDWVTTGAGYSIRQLPPAAPLLLDGLAAVYGPRTPAHVALIRHLVREARGVPGCTVVAVSPHDWSDAVGPGLWHHARPGPAAADAQRQYLAGVWARQEAALDGRRRAADPDGSTPPTVLVVFDDCSGVPFASELVSKLFRRGRHISLSVLWCAARYVDLPVALRKLAVVEVYTDKGTAAASAGSPVNQYNGIFQARVADALPAVFQNGRMLAFWHEEAPAQYLYWVAPPAAPSIDPS